MKFRPHQARLHRRIHFHEVASFIVWNPPEDQYLFEPVIPFDWPGSHQFARAAKALHIFAVFLVGRTVEHNERMDPHVLRLLGVVFVPPAVFIANAPAAPAKCSRRRRSGSL